MSDKDQITDGEALPGRDLAARPTSDPTPTDTPASDDDAAKAPPPSDRSDGNDAFDAIGPYLHPGRLNVMAIYVLYLLAIVPAFGIVPAIIGFVMAVMNRGKADETWNSHYDFQVRQGVMALIAAIVSVILLFVLIGFIGLAALAIWWVIRSVIGLMTASRNERIRDPETYTW